MSHVVYTALIIMLVNDYFLHHTLVPTLSGYRSGASWCLSRGFSNLMLNKAPVQGFFLMIMFASIDIIMHIIAICFTNLHSQRLYQCLPIFTSILNYNNSNNKCTKDFKHPDAWSIQLSNFSNIHRPVD